MPFFFEEKCETKWTLQHRFSDLPSPEPFSTLAACEDVVLLSAPKLSAHSSLDSRVNLITMITSHMLTENRVLCDEIVTLYVGPKHKKFTVHKTLLCDRCEYFSKAFHGNFKEAQEGVMYLPEDDADTVSSLVDFLYRGTVPKITWESKELTRPLRRLYYLAEKLCLSELMDQVIDEISSSIARRNTKLGELAIRDVYAHTHEKSKLRLFCSAALVCAVSKGSFFDESWCNKYSAIFSNCPEFFRDMFQFQVQHSKAIHECSSTTGALELAISFGPCKFHSHERDEECYLKGSK